MLARDFTNRGLGCLPKLSMHALDYTFVNRIFSFFKQYLSLFFVFFFFRLLY